MAPHHKHTPSHVRTFLLYFFPVFDKNEGCTHEGSFFNGKVHLYAAMQNDGNKWWHTFDDQAILFECFDTKCFLLCREGDGFC